MDLMKKYIQISENIDYLNNLNNAEVETNEIKKELKKECISCFFYIIHFICIAFSFIFLGNSVKEINEINNISNDKFHIVVSISNIMEQNIAFTNQYYISLFFTNLLFFMFIYLVMNNPVTTLHKERDKKEKFKLISKLFFASLGFFILFLQFESLVGSFIIFFTGLFAIFSIFTLLYLWGISFKFKEFIFSNNNKEYLKKESNIYVENDLEKLKKEKKQIFNEILNKKENIMKITKIYYSNDFLQKEQFYYENIINEFKNKNQKEKSEEEKMINLIEKTFSTSKIKNY